MNDTERKSVEHYMRTLGCTYEEALQLIQDDKETDRGIAHDWDLSKEEMRQGLKAIKPDRKPTTAKTPRTKKENPEKQKIISLLFEILSKEMKNVSVVNKEKSIDFEGENGVKYTVSLVAHRK